MSQIKAEVLKVEITENLLKMYRTNDDLDKMRLANEFQILVKELEKLGFDLHIEKKPVRRIIT